MAIEFNGSTQYLEQLGITAFTAWPTSFSCWVYLSGLTTAMAAVGLGGGTNQWVGQLRYRGDTTEKKSEYGIWNNATSTSTFSNNNATSVSKPLSTGVWYLLAGYTTNGSTVTLYDGDARLIFTHFSTTTIAFPTATQIRVGATPHTVGGYWNGRLAHPAIWNNYRLTPQDFWRLREGARPNSGTVGPVANLYDYWRLNGTVDTTAGNQTGVKGNVLTAVASPVHKAGPTGLDSYATFGQPLTGLADGTYHAMIYNNPEQRFSTRVVWQGDIVVSGGVSSTQVTTALANGAMAYTTITSQTASQTDQGRNTIAGPVILNHAV